MNFSARSRQDDSARPVGFVRPANDEVARAAEFIDMNRWDDASLALRAIVPIALIDRAWTEFLWAMIADGRRDHAEHEARLRACVTLALAGEFASPSRDEPLLDGSHDAPRLAALALSALGAAARRGERLDEARSLHAWSLSLRRAGGSLEEEWDSLMECAADADVQGRMNDAMDFARVAIATASRIPSGSAGRQSDGWRRLSEALDHANRGAEAIEAQRQSLSFARSHDSGGVAVARAELRLGSMLLRSAARALETGDAFGPAHLAEAAMLLAAARESLAAFGRDHDAEVRWADLQIDFAVRLRESVAPLTAVE